MLIGDCRAADSQDFFTSYDEVYESFDSMGLQENLLRGIYAYGMIALALAIFSCLSSFLLNFIFLCLKWLISWGAGPIFDSL